MTGAEKAAMLRQIEGIRYRLETVAASKGVGLAQTIGMISAARDMLRALTDLTESLIKAMPAEGETCESRDRI